MALKNDGGIYKFLERSIPVLLGIFIFIIPFPHNTAAQGISLYLSLAILLFLIIRKHTHFSFKSPFTVPFIFFSLWVLFCIPFALNKGNSFHDFYTHLLKYLIIFYILLNYFKSKRLFLILCWIIVISITIFSIGGTIYYYLIKGAALTDRLGLPEVEVDINHIGFLAIPALFMIIVFLAELDLYKKLFLLVALISTTSAVVLSGTRGALLGMLIPMPFLFIKNKKALMIAAACILLLIMLTPFKSQLHIQALQEKIYEDKEIGRFAIWYTYAQSIKDHPITGIGYGMQIYDADFFIKNNLKLPHKYQAIVSLANGNPAFTPHNTFVDLTVRTGFIGLALFLYLLYTFLRVGLLLYRNTKDVFVQNWTLCLMACCLSLLIQGMFVDLMIGKQVIYLFIFFAMMNILWQIHTNNNLSEQRRENP